MRFSILTLLIFVSLIGGCLAWALGPSRVRSALPWNATEIEEHYDGLASDFIRILRARIDEDDFDSYAQRLGLTEKYAENPATNIHWPTCDQPWWNPPDSLDNVRYEPIELDDYLVIATYHDRHVYFAAMSW